MRETPFLDHPDGVLPTLKRVPLLEKIDEAHLDEIFRGSLVRHYEADEIIIAEGECEESLHILLSGQVKIVKHGAVVAWLRQPGSVFGELALIDALPRSATVVALEPVSCLTMEAACLDRLPPIDQAVVYAILYRSLARVVTERLRATSDELASLKRGLMAGGLTV